MTHYITFPGLFDKILTVPTETFFGIKLYAVMIMSGFLLAAIYAMVRAKEFNTNADQIADLLIFALPLSIIGARIYYVANMWDYYSQHLNEIIAVWEGGIAIYGAIIAAAIVVFVFAKVKKADVLSLLDLGSLGLLIGQSIGRWGNFFNAEAFGGPTDLPWGMVIRKSIQSNGVAVHPTFLYESLWNALGFVLLHFYSKKRKFKGEICLMYIAWYGFGRMFIEGLRTDSLYVGATDIRISQVLAAASCIFAIGMLIYFYVSKKGKPVLEVSSETALQSETADDLEGNINTEEKSEINSNEINIEEDTI